MPGDLAYVLACLVLPAVWGVVMHHAFAWVDRRRRRRDVGNEPPPIDYSI